MIEDKNDLAVARATRTLGYATRMEWKPVNAQYSSGELLYCGSWNVGGFHYNNARTNDDPLKYCATCTLPGIKANLGYFKTSEEAKAKAENAATHWFSKLGY